MAENKKSSLIGSIARSIKSKMSLGSSSTREQASADATAENKQSVENIDFEQIKSSFMNIEGSVNKLNEIFEGINNNLRAILDKNKQEEYLAEENRLEGRPIPEPKGKKDNEKDKPSFFDGLKELFKNPAVIASLASLVYFILPKETQERIKAVLGGFSDGLDLSSIKFSELSDTTKMVGIGLATYLGSKLIRNIADAIGSVMKMITAISKMGKFGKAGAIVALGATAFAVTKTYMAFTGEPEEEEPVTEKTAQRETNISNEAEKTSTVLTKEEAIPTGKEADKTDEAKSANVTISREAPPAYAGGATIEAKPTPSASQPETAPETAPGAEAEAPVPNRTPNLAERMEAAAQGETALPPAPPVATPSATPTVTTPMASTPAPRDVTVATKPSVAATPKPAMKGKGIKKEDTPSFWDRVKNFFKPAAASIPGGHLGQAHKFIKYKEGFPKGGKAYKDFPGVAIGYGHQIQPNEYKQGFVQAGDEQVRIVGDRGLGTVITPAQADKLLTLDLPKYIKAAKDPLGDTAWGKLDDNQKAALVSYTYNTGSTTRLVRYGLKDAILSGQFQRASGIIAEYGTQTSNGGQPSPGLTTRRQEEAMLFASGKMPAGSARAAMTPKPDTTATTGTNVVIASTPIPTTPTKTAEQINKQYTPAIVATPTESPKTPKGVEIASLSTKNEAMASPKPMAPQIQNANNTKNVGVNGNSSKAIPNEIPSPIASRGSLSGNVRHATQYT